MSFYHRIEWSMALMVVAAIVAVISIILGWATATPGNTMTIKEFFNRPLGELDLKEFLWWTALMVYIFSSKK